jgi:hypothetical protein
MRVRANPIPEIAIGGRARVAPPPVRELVPAHRALQVRLGPVGPENRTHLLLLAARDLRNTEHKREEEPKRKNFKRKTKKTQ